MKKGKIVEDFEEIEAIEAIENVRDILQPCRSSKESTNEKDRRVT